MKKQLATALIDAIASVALILATRYLSPSDLDTVKQLVLALQPLAIAYIVAEAYNEKAEVQARTDIHSAALYAGVTQGDAEARIATVLSKHVKETLHG